jgi:hypothetical protein
MAREKKTDTKFCIDRKSEFSEKLSDHFERGKVLPFEELWDRENRMQLELTDKEKQNYDIIQFSFVMLNNEDKPLFIERKEKAHRITTGGSILQSCSPVTSPIGTFPRSIADIEFYFEQEVKIKHPKPPDYKIDLLGIARNVRKRINYYFYIFCVKFPVKEPNLSLRKDPDVILGFYDPNSKRQLLKGKKVDLRVLKALFPQFEVPPEEVEGCILHRDINSNIHDELFTTKKPEIKEKHIADTLKEWIKVCLVQLDYSLTERFPYTLKEDDKIDVKNKIFEAMKIANEEGADIVCFPEHSFAKEWVEEIKNQCKDMVVICGSFYDAGYNICPIIIDEKDWYYKKCHPSPVFEEDGMKQGTEILVFQTKCGKISVLTCIDFDYEHNGVYEHDVNIILNPRCDIDRDYTFQKIDRDIDLPDGSNAPAFILQVNAARVEWGEDKGGGGTCIIGYEKRQRLERYKREGLRPEDGIKYKICQAKGEMMIIAELNITPTTGKKRVKMSEWYKYDGKYWKKSSRNVWQ